MWDVVATGRPVTVTDAGIARGRPGVALGVVSQLWAAQWRLCGRYLRFPARDATLLGRNGAGKSTLFRLIAGVEPASLGQVTREGGDIQVGTVRRDHLQRSAWLPQAFSAPAHLTVTQYVRYAGWLKGTRGRRLTEAVSRIGEGQSRGAATTSRRSAVGRDVPADGGRPAIVHQPDLLILDEPTVGLDPEQRGDFHRLTVASPRMPRCSSRPTFLEDVAALRGRVLLLR